MRTHRMTGNVRLCATRNALTKNSPAKVDLVKAQFLGFGVEVIVDFAGLLSIMNYKIQVVLKIARKKFSLFYFFFWTGFLKCDICPNNVLRTINNLFEISAGGQSYAYIGLLAVFLCTHPPPKPEPFV